MDQFVSKNELNWSFIDLKWPNLTNLAYFFPNLAYFYLKFLSYFFLS